MNNANWSVIAHKFLKYTSLDHKRNPNPNPLSRFSQFRTEQVQWNLDVTKLYITKTSV